MTPKRQLPATASFATAEQGGKLHAPSAARNIVPILHAIQKIVPPHGKALELASGTGEHVVQYAAHFPDLAWQPTEIDPARLTSISARTREADATNISSPRAVDACSAGWSDMFDRQDLIIWSNLLHLISEPEAGVILTEAAKGLKESGVLIIYGPFLRGETFASEGDRRFHESLRESDPEIGYKSFQRIQNQLAACGLINDPPIEMPANNLILVARKP